MLRLCLFAVLFIVTACEASRAPHPEPTVATTPVPMTSIGVTTQWGEPVPLAHAATFDAPALTAAGNTFILGAFELIGNAPTLVTYRDGIRTASDVTANQPHSLSLFPAEAGGILALWIDGDDSEIQKLNSAYLDTTGKTAVSAATISASAVTRYAAIKMPDSSYWVVWSTPISGESALIGVRIDAAGRPRTSQPLRIDADFPTITVTQTGNVLLYWLDGTLQNLYGAEITDAGLTRIAQIAPNPLPIQPADQLLRFDAAVDMTHAYVFWQIRTHTGAAESWWLSLPIGGTSPDAARPLRIKTSSVQAQTGFNHGTAYEAKDEPDGDPVLWTQPNTGQNETLPVAAVIHDHLAVVYFRNGRVVAQQVIAAAESPLIAPPRIGTDSERDIILAWWLPDSPQNATLYSIQSR